MTYRSQKKVPSDDMRIIKYQPNLIHPQQFQYKESLLIQNNSKINYLSPIDDVNKLQRLKVVQVNGSIKQVQKNINYKKKKENLTSKLILLNNPIKKYNITEQKYKTISHLRRFIKFMVNQQISKNFQISKVKTQIITLENIQNSKFYWILTHQQFQKSLFHCKLLGKQSFIQYPKNLLNRNRSKTDQILILSDTKNIKTLLYKQGSFKFIWIDKNANSSKRKSKFDQFNTHFQAQSFDSFHNICDELKMNQRKIYNIIYYGPISKFMYEELQRLHLIPNVNKIYIFNDNNQQNKDNQIFQIRLFFAKNIGQLLNIVSKDCYSTERRKILPNFVRITNEDKALINKQRLCLFSLFLFKDREKAKFDFLKIASQIIFQKQLKIFQENYSIDLPYHQIIKWYTKSNFFHYLLNNLLRATSNPTETAYVRLPFQDIFYSIKRLYKQQKGYKYSGTLYRGGFCSQQQIQYFKSNKNGYVEMLGFLSTSKKRQIAELFCKNIIFEIQVINEERQEQCDYGFADITPFSQFNFQEQVLFNPLNVFKIKQVSENVQILNEGNKVTIIRLIYGEMAKVIKMKKLSKKLNFQQKILSTIYQHQFQILKLQSLCQGDILMQLQFNNQALKYFELKLQKFLLHIEYQKSRQNLVQLSPIYRNISKIYLKIGKYQKSLQYCQLCLSTSQNEKKNANYLHAINDLGTVYYHLGKYEQALKYFTKCNQMYQIYQDVFKSRYPQLFILSSNNIGAIYIEIGKYIQALKYYQYNQKFIQQKQEFGENHNYYLTSLNNIGLTYLKMGQYRKALTKFVQCQTQRKIIKGQMHSQYLQCLNNIGTAYFNMQEFDKSLQYYLKCSEIRKSTIGEKHPQYVTTLNNIGNVYYQIGQYEISRQYHLKCLELKKQILGRNHPDYCLSLTNIGTIYYSQQNYYQALQYYKECQQIQRHIYGVNHQFYYKTILNIVLVYKILKNQEKIDQIYDQYLKKQDINKKLNYEILINFLQFYLQKNDLVKILEIYKELEQIQKDNINQYGQQQYLKTLKEIQIYADKLNDQQNFFKYQLKQREYFKTANKSISKKQDNNLESSQCFVSIVKDQNFQKVPQRIKILEKFQQNTIEKKNQCKQLAQALAEQLLQQQYSISTIFRNGIFAQK